MYNEQITKTDLNVIKKLKANPFGTTVSYRGFAKHLHIEKGVGTVKGNKITFDTRDINPKIREYVKTILKFDFVLENVPEEIDRVSATQNFNNEKLFGTSVKKNIFYISCATNMVFTSERIYHLFPGSHFGVTLEQLKDIKHEAVLLVENFEAFRAIDHAMVKKLGIDRDTLILYRGDNQGGVAKKSIKDELCISKLIGWFDSDPAGYSMILDYQCDEYIVPVVDKETLKAHGSMTNYTKQYRYVPSVKEKFSDETLSLLIEVEKGFTQEAAILHCNDFERKKR